MKKISAWFGFLLTIAGASLAFPIPWDGGFEETLRQSDGVLKDWTRPMYLVKVVQSSEPGTVGNPPASLVQFERTLRGPLLAGEKQVVWTFLIAAIAEVDPACSTIPYDPKRECRTVVDQKSLQKEVRPPAVGAELIIATHTTEEISLRARHPGAIPGVNERVAKTGAVASFGGYPATLENLDTFTRYATYSQRWTRTYMGTLFVAILLLAISSMVGAAAKPRAGIAIALITVLVFFCYQDGFEVQENIRVDLLIIYPAMIATLLSLVISVARILKGQKA